MRRETSAPIHPDMLLALPASELQQIYAETLNRLPPPRASIEFLRNTIAWSTQAKTYGKDPVALRQSLYKAAQQALNKIRPNLTPGTALIREWQGQTYEVTVLEKGYHWQGKTYSNLSQIAREITGTRWSGPRFFGLNGSKS